MLFLCVFQAQEMIEAKDCGQQTLLMKAVASGEEAVVEAVADVIAKYLDNDKVASLSCCVSFYAMGCNDSNHVVSMQRYINI